MKAQEYRVLVEKFDELNVQWSACNQHRSFGSRYNPNVARLEIATLRARLAVEEGAASYNRTAPDLEELRDFLIAELEAAREEYARIEQSAQAEREIPPLPTLTSPDVEAVRVHRAYPSGLPRS